MNIGFGSPLVLVPMRPATLALLDGRRRSENETLDSVVERLAGSPCGSENAPEFTHAPSPATAGHRAEVFGEIVGAPTLGRLFGVVVDRINEIAPEAIEALSRKRARIRAFVAYEKCGVHPDRSDLRVVQTRSGWWVSANVGETDVRRGLRALCGAAGLKFGEDIRFPAR
jgi:hypothetical protein